MKMLAAMRKLFASFSEDELYRRALRGDAKFFSSLYVPLVARAIDGVPKLVIVSRTDSVMDLDCDHAVIALTTPKARVFGTELGTSVFEGTPTHFLVELDPASTGFGGRLGNYGPLELASDAETSARQLGDAVRAILAG